MVYTKEKIAVVNIPEQEKDQIFLNQKVIISSGKKVLNGYIKRISPAIDPESGTFKTTIEVKDAKIKALKGARICLENFVCL